MEKRKSKCKGKRYESSKQYPGVRKYKGANTWEWRATVDGTSYSASGFKTAHEAYAAREKFCVEMRENGYSTSTCKKTLSVVYNEYYDSQLKVKAYATLKKYVSQYKNHIEPFFGKKRIKDITTADIEEFFSIYANPIEDKKHGTMRLYSHEFINGFRKLLNNIFIFAIKNRYITVNPMLAMSKDLFRDLGVTKEEGKVLTEDEVSILDNYLSKSHLHVAFMIGYYTGMRISEVCGLMWPDIDFKNHVIRVRHQLVPVDGIWCFSGLKTAAANRDIVMPPTLEMYLRVVKEKQEQNKRAKGDRYMKTNYVGRIDNDKSIVMLNDKEIPFVNVKTSGEVLTPTSLRYISTIARLRFGIDITFHDLRHTHLTMCAQGGMAPRELQLRAGHVKITTTIATYYHSTPATRINATKVLSSLEIKDYQKVLTEKAVDDEVLIELAVAGELYEEEETLSSADILGGEFNKHVFITN